MATSDPTPIAAEFLIEPFSAGQPGAHVEAALTAFEERDVPVELGAFASTAAGPLDVVSEALADAIRRAIAAGATNIRIQVAHDVAELRARDLHEALPEMLQELVADHGPIDRWDRTTKQAAVQTLAERGAFLLRGSVDEVAEAMGVTRITIYNYLNAVED